MTTDDPLSGPPGRDESDRATPSMGTLVIRTWNEPDQAQGFRARLTYTQSPTAEPKSAYAGDPEEVLRLVREWLLSQSERPRGA